MLKSGPMDIGAVGNWGTCGANEIADLWFFTKGLSIVVFPFTRFHKSPNSLSDQGLYKALMQVGLSLVVVSLADTSIILGSTLRPLGSLPVASALWSLYRPLAISSLLNKTSIPCRQNFTGSLGGMAKMSTSPIHFVSVMIMGRGPLPGNVVVVYFLQGF
eukprot:Em0006g834a